jgi:dihydroorotate dehydrogenase electron transfer subunit
MDSRGSLHRALKILQKVQENTKTISLVLDGSLTCSPGQFAMLWLPGIDEKPFSLAGSDPLMFTVSRVGPFSEALQSLGPGDTLWVRGPFGRGFTVAPESTLLVGGGYGAAPLAYLAGALRAADPRVRIEAALGARTSADLLFVGRFGALGVPVHAATEDGSEGTAGLVTDVVEPLLAAGELSRVRACGPEAMLEEVARLCRGAGAAAELSFEAYMRCGVGLCGSCEHGGRLVCMDGPVFMTAEAQHVGSSVLRI